MSATTLNPKFIAYIDNKINELIANGYKEDDIFLELQGGTPFYSFLVRKCRA